MPGGDRAIEVELGDEMSFELNFQVHQLSAAIRQARIKGIVELIPELASFQISYDPDAIGFADVCREVSALRGADAGAADAELPSRLFSVPVVYFDQWTEACVADYRAKVVDKTPDPDLVCELNGLADRDTLRRLHASSEYWVAALGFWPGLCSLMPLDERARLFAPKYNPPRTWTPKGTIGLGGALTCIYPDQTPGGYQLLGRTPMPIWDREQRLPAFRDSLALFKPGDRVRFVPIDVAEYEWIDAKVREGVYQHPNVDYQKFSVRAYRDWLKAIPARATS
ncbi:MAG TPA: allophanate hydrolase subunit 1 [Nordella sp.]|nr:allophanate hydrolase subunit 1 [Nordella sp.]